MRYRVSLALLFPALVAVLSAQTKLLRFPDIHDHRVVFTYGGDLWLVADTGGTATRLTAHPGVEVFAKFSPDGKWIAFTGQYDGDEQVYIIPSEGGEPKELTFYPARGPLPARHGSDNQVIGWTNDARYVVFRSLRDSWALPISRLIVNASSTYTQTFEFDYTDGTSVTPACDLRHILLTAHGFKVPHGPFLGRSAHGMRWLLERIVYFRQVYQALLAKLFSFLSYSSPQSRSGIEGGEGSCQPPPMKSSLRFLSLRKSS